MTDQFAACSGLPHDDESSHQQNWMCSWVLILITIKVQSYTQLGLDSSKKIWLQFRHTYMKEYSLANILRIQYIIILSAILVQSSSALHLIILLAKFWSQRIDHNKVSNTVCIHTDLSILQCVQYLKWLSFTYNNTFSLLVHKSAPLFSFHDLHEVAHNVGTD